VFWRIEDMTRSKLDPLLKDRHGRTAGYGRRWLGAKTPKALNVTAGLVFFGFALRLLWKLLQTMR
jgi:hypothetical protein